MTDTNKLLAALLAALTGEAKVTMGKKGRASGQRRNPKFKAKAKPDTTALCIAAFEAKGFKDVQPKVNVMTYKHWVAKGRKVIPGQKGIKVGPFTLFHKEQTQPITAADTTGVQQMSMVKELELEEARRLDETMVYDSVKAAYDEAAIAEYGV